jgi:hypothetical protein
MRIGTFIVESLDEVKNPYESEDETDETDETDESEDGSDETEAELP